MHLVAVKITEMTSSLKNIPNFILEHKWSSDVDSEKNGSKARCIKS